MATINSRTYMVVGKSKKPKRSRKCKTKEIVEKEFKMDIISNLPIEIAQIILMQLSPDDAINAWRCNRRWKDVMNDNYFWERKCRSDKYYELKDENKSKVYNSFIEKFSYWQGVYMYNQRLQYKWKTHAYVKVKIPHVSHYQKMHYFDDNMLLATTTRNVIRVIDSSTGKINSGFSCWTEGRIVKVIKRGNFLLAYNTNNCLKVWNTTSKMCVLDMELVVTVLALDLYRNLLILGYESGEFSILNVESGLVVYDVDYESPVNCISFYNDFIFTGNLNGEIQGIEIGQECKIVYSFFCYRNLPVFKMIIKNDGYMVIYSQGGIICVYKLCIPEKLHTIYAHPTIQFFYTYEDQFFCIARDGISIEVWNFVTGNRLLCINNKVPVTFLRTNGTQVIVCSTQDNSIKMWCLNTGRFISKINLRLRLYNLQGIFFTKTKLVYFGWPAKKNCSEVMCIRNYEL